MASRCAFRIPPADRSAQRNQVAPETPVESLIAAAIMDKGALVGVIEAVNKLDGTQL